VATLLQISDPHFGTERPYVVAALLELARQIQPELVVLSGDITQRARTAQFAAAAAFVQQLQTQAPLAVLAIPGNHDIPLFNVLARARHPYAGFAAAFGANLEPHYSSAALLVIGVNTTRPTRHKDGEVSAAQIERVSSLVRSARPEQLRIVVVHQPVHVIRTQDIENLLRGHESAVRAWAEAGADVVMGGHIHLPYVRALNEHITRLQRRIWVVQAGTAVSYRVRHEAPNSVNVLRHDAGNLVCRVEQWNYAGDSGGFTQAQHHELLLER
jgi:3',5'-cyclic AMP phosphodiesterase CpdA